MPVSLNSLRADLVAERDGADVGVPEWPEVTLRVRGVNYAPYQAAVDAATQRLRLVHGDIVPADAWGPALGQAMADHLLLGWSGFDETYSHAAAVAILTDPGHREFRGAVIKAATQVGRASAKFVDGLVGN